MDVNNILINEIQQDDFFNYIQLMYEFSNYKKDIHKDDFINYISKYRDIIRIFVIKHNNICIGAGSLFILDKLHNNKVGQIEDVIITKKYRKYGYGKMLIDKLVEVANVEFNCYKVILNCLEKNIGFYEKCNFNNVGVQMRYNNISQ